MPDAVMPIVTVITVTYNSAPYVRQAIESVLSSSHTDFELIIGDDGSRDNTWDIVREFNDSRIINYRNAVNMGEYQNRNKALGMARGKYVLYVDGDDILYPHGLEFMVKMLNAFPECGMAVMYGYRNNMIFPVIITPHQFFIAEYFHQGFIPTSLNKALFSTEMLRKVGGFPTRFISNDVIVRYYVALVKPSLIISDNLTWWRETPGQQSSQLLTTTRGTIEIFLQKREILAHPDCPLNAREKEFALFNIERTIFMVAMKALLSLKFRTFDMLRPLFKWRFTYFLRRPVVKDPFVGYSASNPLVCDLRRNPFSQLVS
jgi:glycosyltransferase involved in cell wall biosynthesis